MNEVAASLERLGSSPVLRWSSLGLVSAALFLFTWAIVSDVDSWLQRAWTRYCARLERKLYKLFIWTPGHRVAGAQIAIILAMSVLKLMLGFSSTIFFALVFVAATGPEAWLSNELYRRKKTIDQQIDGFLVALSNALKSRPNIGDAIASIANVVTDPIRQEVDLVAKHMRMGSTLDQALLAMSGRVGSRQFDAAISSILVGRQVGGNVSEILETTAASIREMARLEGVVRSKTAEGKAQIWVLAVFPFLLILAYSLASPGYFDLLSQSTVGYICTLIAFGLWAASIVSARRILRVDI
jgi:tight adherence protein B